MLMYRNPPKHTFLILNDVNVLLYLSFDQHMFDYII